ncbi:MAG: hypothetical protein COC06_02940 [Bacteroidales bacterium]|nr:MAG: hypothetical protein COC06_02940 [Bacteroidales bacterium]
MNNILLMLILLVPSITIGQTEIPYQELNAFNNGYAVVEIGYSYGVIDTTGKKICSLDYDSYRQLPKINGSKVIPGNGIYINKEKGLSFSRGLKRLTGEVILKPIYDIEFVNNFFVVKNIKHQTIVLNKDGVKISELKIDYHDKLYPLSDSLYAVKNKWTYALIDINSNSVTEDKYYGIGSCKNGLIKVQKSSPNKGGLRWGFINARGETIIDFVYSKEPSSFNNGFAIVKNKAGKYGFINKKSDVIIKPIYQKVFAFQDGLALVQESIYSKKNKIIDKNGEIIFNIDSYGIPFSYTNKPLGSKSIVIIYETVSSKKRCLLFNTKTGSLIKTNYNYIGEFNSGLAKVRINNTKEKFQGFINMKGELVIKTEQESQF